MFTCILSSDDTVKMILLQQGSGPSVLFNLHFTFYLRRPKDLTRNKQVEMLFLTTTTSIDDRKPTQVL